MLIKSRTIKDGVNPYYGVHLLILFFGILKFSLHLITINGYGLHADELYYIELSRQFEWGYLDISPFVTWMARCASIFGESTFAWRLLPILFSSFTVMLTGYLARVLGGGKLAIAISCSAIICSPAVLATSYLLQPAVFDQFFWVLLTFALIAFQKERQRSYLYLASLAFSFGMLNKYTILFYALSLALGYLIYYRKTLRFSELKLWAGPCMLSVAVLFPNMLWQWQHGFPIFHYSGVVASGALQVDVGDYLFQLFFFHGASVAVWTAGLFFIIFQKENQQSQRIWAFSFLLIIASLLLLKGKLYYGLGIFPLFFAYGGYCWEMMFNKSNRIFKVLFFIVVYAFGILSLPLVIPLFSLPVSKIYITKMVKLTSFSRPLLWEDNTVGTIPQFFADMTGWNTAAAKVMQIAESYPDKKMMVLTDDYAIAGGMKYFAGPDMPQVVSPQNSFSLHSPASLEGKNIIYLSKNKIERAELLAENVKFAEALEIENSHLNGIHIYILFNASPHLQKIYRSEREAFYPQARHAF